MSRRTREINRVTTAVISVSLKTIILVLVALILYEGAVRGYAFGHEVFDPEAVSPPPGTEKTVEIGEGATAAETAAILKKAGLIEDELIFKIQARFYEYEIHPGSYTLSTAMTSKEMLQILNEEPKETEKEQ